MFIYPTQRERTERNDPDAGVYRGKLRVVHRYPMKNGNPAILLKWELDSHPNKAHIWEGTQFFGLKNPGLLAKAMCNWKKLRWEAFCSMGPNRQPYPEMFLNEEADLAITPPPPAGKIPMNVYKLFPPGDLVSRLADGTYVVNTKHPFIKENYPDL